MPASIAPARISVPAGLSRALVRRLHSVVAEIQDVADIGIQANSSAVWKQLGGGRSGQDVFSLAIYPPRSSNPSHQFIAKEAGTKTGKYRIKARLISQGIIHSWPGPPISQGFRLEYHADGTSVHEYVPLIEYVSRSLTSSRDDPMEVGRDLLDLTDRLTRLENPVVYSFGDYADLARLKETLLPDYLVTDPKLSLIATDNLITLMASGHVVSDDYVVQDYLEPEPSKKRDISCVSATVLSMKKSGMRHTFLFETAHGELCVLLHDGLTTTWDEVQPGDALRVAFNSTALKSITSFFRGYALPTSLLTYRQIASEFDEKNTFQIVARHGDLHQGNVLCNGKNVWVIDWDNERQDTYYSDIARLEVSFWYNWPDQSIMKSVNVNAVIGGKTVSTGTNFEGWATALRKLSAKPSRVRDELASADFKFDIRLSLLLQLGKYQRYWFNEIIEQGADARIKCNRPLFAVFSKFVVESFCNKVRSEGASPYAKELSIVSAPLSEAEVLKQRFSRFLDIRNVMGNIKPSVGTTYFHKTVLSEILSFAAKLFKADYATVMIKREIQADAEATRPGIEVPRAYMVTVCRFAKHAENVIHPHGIILSMKDGKGVIATAFRGAAPILKPDVTTDPSYMACYYGIRSELVVPVFDIGAQSPLSSNHIFCMLNIESARPGHFVTEGDIPVATLVATHIELAMQHAVLNLVSYEMLFEDFLTDRQISNTTLIDETINHQPPKHSLLSELETKLRQLSGSESLRLSTLRIGLETNELRLVPSRGVPKQVKSYDSHATPLATALAESPGCIFVPSESFRVTPELGILLQSSESMCAAWIELVCASKIEHEEPCRVFLQLEALGGKVPIDLVAGDQAGHGWQEEASLLLAFYLLKRGLGITRREREPLASLPSKMNTEYERFIQRKRFETTVAVERERRIAMDKLYSQRVLVYLRKCLSTPEEGAVLEHVLPSVAFRECFPLRNGIRAGPSAHIGPGKLANFAGPLQPYRLPDSQPLIPRKTEPELAKWLATCLTDYSDETNPLAPIVLVLGDGGSDLELAKNLARKTSPRLNVCGSIMNKGLPKTVLELNCRISADWQTWERETKKLLTDGYPKDSWNNADKYIICDIDKSLIMPEGHDESTAALLEARVAAYSKMLQRLCLREVSLDEARKLYDESDRFPPYVTSATRGDEDVRALAALLLGLGVLSSGGWAHDVSEREPQLLDYVVAAIENADAGRLDAKILSVLSQIHERVEAGVPTILEEFRECEHDAFLTLQKEGKYYMNGRVLECLKLGCEHGWVPIGYSDRPGASVGLRVDAHHSTSWPIIPESIISLPAKIVRPA